MPLDRAQFNHDSSLKQTSSAKERLFDDVGNRSVIESAVHKAVGLAVSKESETRDFTENCASEFVKAVPLFIGGRRGLVLSTIAFGLAEVKVNHTLEQQGTELGFGMTKGFLTKEAFEAIGKKEWGFAAKGMAMGSSSRFLDTALTPANYLVNGKLDLTGGVSRSVSNASDLQALGIDAITFGAAHYMPGLLSAKVVPGSMLSSTMTGSAFGFTSGVLGEMQSQAKSGQSTDVAKILLAGGREAGLMAAAAATGHKLTVHKPVIQMKERESRPEANPNLVERAETKETENIIFSKPTKDPGGYVGYFLNEKAAARVQNNLIINGESVTLKWTPPATLHVTEQFGIKQSVGEQWAQAGGRKPEIKVIGLALDATGVEALHVSVDGRTIREDGKPYHITRSLAPGHSASESMAVVEKAIAAERVRSGRTENTTATDSGEIVTFSAVDLARYSYRPLPVHEQFAIEAEPRFKQSDATAAKVKEVKPKPELPFEELSAKLQVISALKSTPPDYLAKTIATRTAEQRAGSYFELTPAQLNAQLYRANWEPFDPRDALGNAIIGGGARGYRATIEGGRLGMTEIKDIASDAQLYLIDPKGIGSWSVSTVGTAEPRVNTVTMIVGEGSVPGKPEVWTFHPGDPVRPSKVDPGQLSQVISEVGVHSDTYALPDSGPGRRIPITREQLNQINARLPADSRFDLAKIEAPENVVMPELKN